MRTEIIIKKFLFIISMLIGISNVSAQIVIDTDQTGIVDYHYDLWGEGFAQSGFPVYFQAVAECECGCSESLYYCWCYDEEGSSYMESANAYFVYSGGSYQPYVYVECPYCHSCDFVYVNLDVISGIEIYYAGISNKICFNVYNSVGAQALPQGVVSSELMDYGVEFQTNDWYMWYDQGDATNLNLPVGDWPISNSAWGAGTLWCGMNHPDDGYEFVTSPDYYVEDTEEIFKFYDGADTACQNPQGTSLGYPNWYYYYTNALQQNNVHAFSDSTSLVTTGRTMLNSGNIWIGIYANDTNTLWASRKYINSFSSIVQHELFHQLMIVHNIQNHASWYGGTPPGMNTSDDPDQDLLCSAGCSNPFEPTFGTQANNAYSHPTYSSYRDDEALAINWDFINQQDYTNIDWAYPGNLWHP